MRRSYDTLLQAIAVSGEGRRAQRSANGSVRRPAAGQDRCKACFRHFRMGQQDEAASPCCATQRAEGGAGWSGARRTCARYYAGRALSLFRNPTVLLHDHCHPLSIGCRARAAGLAVTAKSARYPTLLQRLLTARRSGHPEGQQQRRAFRRRSAARRAARGGRRGAAGVGIDVGACRLWITVRVSLWKAHSRRVRSA